MLESYFEQENERAAAGLPPLPLTPAEVEDVCRCLEKPKPAKTASSPGPPEEQGRPGRGPGGQGQGRLADPGRAREDRLPGRAPDGRRVPARDDAGRLQRRAPGRLPGATRTWPRPAADALKTDRPRLRGLRRLVQMSEANPYARAVLDSWAKGEWFLSQARVPGGSCLKVFKVDGEINTDDFSPAGHAPTRPDIPLHAQAMGQTRFPGGLETIRQFREEGHRVAFVGDVVGTGSSRKSACNSRDVAHRRGHPLRPQQAAGRRHHGRAHRPHLLQHDRGLRRPADHVRRHGG